jgi:hypothetical protein
MMIGEISFCDKTGFNIKTDDTKKYILERLLRRYKLKIIAKHFEKYENQMLENIKTRPHLLCVRSNGNPYFLYLTKLNFVNYCIFIDKKIQQGYSYPRMIISHFQFDETLFEDTILDGEMVKTIDGHWTYLINDMIVYKGQHLTDSNIVKRLNLLYEMLQSDLTPNDMDICQIAIKKYFTYTEGMDMITKHLNNINYSSRGIYIKPLFLRFKDILINFDDNLIKKVERQKYKHIKSFMLKEDGDKLLDPETSSISSDISTTSVSSIVSASCISKTPSQVMMFSTRKTNLPDVYEILASNTTLNSNGYACVPSIQISTYLRKLFMNKNIVDTIELKYEYSTKFNNWIPIIPVTC